MSPTAALHLATGEMTLWEHLEELRARLIRSAFYVAVGMVLAWVLYPQIYDLIWTPMERVLASRPEWSPVFTDLGQAFTLRVQISLTAGLLLALPLITLELWGFIAPGLSAGELRACRIFFPLSVLLFGAGAACGFALTEPALQWLAGHVPAEARVFQTPEPYLNLVVKLVVGCGICFQAPVILMLLTWIGLVSADTLRKSWRGCLVGCVVVAAVATPGGDPFLMLLFAAPLAMLYGLGLVLCALVERFRD